MKALTLHQPWASLVAVGAKHIETRSWATKYRGPLLIHAAARPVTDGERVGSWEMFSDAELPWMRHDDTHQCVELDLGAVVATAQLVDCVPIIGGHDPRSGLALRDAVGEPSGPRLLLVGPKTYDPHVRDVEDQRPFGDFTPGRFAWLLDDVQPTTTRCPRCWGIGGDRTEEHVRFWGDGDEWTKVYADHTCPTCSGRRSCDPVPMRGRQGLWTPKPEDWP